MYTHTLFMGRLCVLASFFIDSSDGDPFLSANLIVQVLGRGDQAHFICADDNAFLREASLSELESFDENELPLGAVKSIQSFFRRHRPGLLHI